MLKQTCFNILADLARLPQPRCWKCLPTAWLQQAPHALNNTSTSNARCEK